MNRTTLSYYASISATVGVIILVCGAWLLSLPRGPGAEEIGPEGLLMPVGLVGISVDFEYSLSKLASLIIGLVIVVGPVLLILPRAPLWRQSWTRQDPAASGHLATP